MVWIMVSGFTLNHIMDLDKHTSNQAGKPEPVSNQASKKTDFPVDFI